MNEVNLKILSDIDCNVYVDNELVAIAKQNQIEIIPLSKGEYWVQCVGVSNKNYKIEQIVSIEGHKVIKLNFIELIESNPKLWSDTELKYSSEIKSYIHTITKKEITSSKYNQGFDFVNGSAIVERDKKYGLINRIGNEFVQCIYNNAYRLGSNLIALKLNKKWGIINNLGQEVISFTCDDYIWFTSHKAFIKEGNKWSLITEHIGSIHYIINREYDDLRKLSQATAAVKNNNKWGIVDNCGRILTEFIYDEWEYVCYPEWFIAGVYSFVRKDGKWGIFDDACNQIVPHTYDRFIRFGSYYAFVEYDNKWGIVDRRGREVVNPIYDDLKLCNNTAFAKKEGKWVLILGWVDIEITNITYDDIKENTTIEKDIAFVKKEGKWGIIHCRGNELTQFIYDDLRIGKSRCWVFVKEGNKWGKINVPSCKYYDFQDDCFEISDSGICLTRNGECRCFPICGKWGVLDNKGNEIIPFVYEKIECFTENLYAVRKDGKWGVLDNEAKEIVSFEYTEVKTRDPLILPMRKGEKWGAIDSGGKEFISFIYDELNFARRGFLIFVKKGDKWGVIDRRENEIVPIIYDSYKEISNNDDYAAFKINDRWTRIGISKKILSIKEGDEIILHNYDNWVYINEKNIAVRRDNKWGIINSSGNEVIPLTYDDCYRFNWGNNLLVKKDGRYGVIDCCGNIIISFLYDDVRAPTLSKFAAKKGKKWGVVNLTKEENVHFIYDECYKCYGFYYVKLGAKWGIIDFLGNEVQSFIYDDLYPIMVIRAIVRIGNKWGMISIKGNEVIPIIYDDLKDMGDNIAVKKDNKWGAFTIEGCEVVQCIYDSYRDLEKNN